MHIFQEGRCRSRSSKLLSLAQLLIAVLGVLLTGAMVGQGMGEGAEVVKRNYLLFGVAAFGAVFQSFRAWTTFFAKPRARVMLTSNTLAVKIRKQPALFFKRSACIAYAPENRVFYFEDGSEFTPRIFALVVDDWQEIPVFIFRRWWSELDLDGMKGEIDADYPITRWALTLYFGEILIGFVIAIFALIGGMTGRLEISTVVGLVCVLALVEVDWCRRHAWLVRRESERGAVQFELP